MIGFEILMEMKAKVEKYKDKDYILVFHPDNDKLLSKYIEENKESKISHIFGMRIFASSFCPKDRICLLSNDVVDGIKEATRGMT